MRWCNEVVYTKTHAKETSNLGKAFGVIVALILLNSIPYAKPISQGDGQEGRTRKKARSSNLSKYVKTSKVRLSKEEGLSKGI